MGIQINGNNDIISALDGSWTAEGAYLNTSGIATATTFKGNVTGTACTFVDGKFTGNVTIGGTLTYEDVTNIDSVGIITAKAGIEVTGGTLKLPAVLQTNTDADCKVLYQHNDNVIHGGSSLHWNPAYDTLKVNSNLISANSMYGAGGTLKVAASNHSSTSYVLITNKVEIGGLVGIGTDDPDNLLHLVGTNTTAWPFTADVSSTYAYTPYPHELQIQNHARDVTGSFAGIYFHSGAAAAGDKMAAARIAAVDSGDYKSDLVFGTRNTNFRERLRITSAGNVGINSTIPSQKLDVMDGTVVVHPSSKTGIALNGIAGQDVGVVRWGGDNHHAIILRGSSSSDGTTITGGDTMEFREYGAYSFKTGNNSGTMTERLHISSAGRVLISTTTEGHGNADDLTVATAGGSLGHTGITIRSGTSSDGNIFFSDATSGDGETKGVIKYSHNTDHMQFNIDGSEALRITSAGNATFSGIATATNHNLSAISATAYNSSNVVDVCVYDTSKDTDGGEWRKKCGNTSWYNETFSATRGSKKEFPAVAVIVLVGGTVSSYGADNNTQKILIYDGDDPTLPLWMAFHGHADEDAFIRGAANYQQKCVDMFNGQMVVGRYGGYGISVVNFIHDRPISYWDASAIGYFDGNISQRNQGAGVLNSGGYGLGNLYINDIAIAALKDSPIDVTTGLPYPTMALATNDGVTIIKSSQDTDSLKYDVVGIKATNGSYNEARKVKIDAHNNMLYAVTEGGSLGLIYQWKLPWGKDLSSGTMAGYSGVAWLHYTPHGIQGTSGTDTAKHPKYTNTDIAVRKNGEIWSVSGDGISVIKPDFNADYTMDKTPMVAGIGTHHNTGWMYGRGTGGCRIGSLCETTAGILGDKGTNLVPNGTFDSNINGWTDIATSYTTETHTSGKLQLVASGGTGRVEEEVTVVSGKRYTYEYQCVSNGGGTNFSHLSTASNGGGTIYATNIGISNTGYHQHTFLASATSLFIQLGATNGTTAQFDNVRVYETSEVMDNGYMNTTPDEQPGHDNGNNTVDGWTATSSAELSIDNYALKIKHVNSGSWSGGGAQYALGSKFVPGVQYCVRWRVKTAGTSGNFTQGIGARIQKDNAGHSNSSLITLINETSDPGSSFVDKVAYFTAERENYGIHFYTYYGVANYEMHIDNISIKPVANSYAITSNFQGKPKGLEPRGRITKEAVATGADLCCYKGFDSYNSLVQRYTSELDYGTGDFYYMVWIHASMNGSGSVEGLISRQADGQESGNRIQIQADNTRRVYMYCGGLQGDTTVNLASAGWTHLAFIRRGEMGYVYADGRLRKYFGDTTNYTNANANLRIGGLSLGSSIEENSYPADQTKFALFKTGGYAPTEKELRVIIKEERKLFGENVKCTLYGASDYQIPAVACDTSTDTIHVGTASGRSEFDGLARINNTTDAITVAISASNGLVAEE